MPHFQLLCVHVALGGDPRSIVPRGEDSPVTYPEYCILQSLHGQGSVTDAYEIGSVYREDSEERERLVGTYTKAAVDGVFSGAFAHLPARAEFPTKEDVEAINKAAEDARAMRKAKRMAEGSKPPKPMAKIETLDVSVT